MNKILILIFISALCSISEAQEVEPVINQQDTLSTYIIKLNDNTVLTGNIINQNFNLIIFKDITLGEVTIHKENVAKITKLENNQYCMVTTNDGKQFSGTIVRQDADKIILKTESLGEITIANTKIRECKLIEKKQLINGRYYFNNPHPTRYFFGPSAIPLDKGDGYYQNAYLIANGFQYGVSDHLSFGGGVVIPFFFYLTPKVGYKIGKNVYAGGGILLGTSFIPDVTFGLAIGYGSMTFGNKENNFTINTGWGYYKEEDYNSQSGNSETQWSFSPKPLFSFNGAVRVTERVSLLTENWVIPYREYDYNSTTNDYYFKYGSVLSLGLRIMGEKHAFDIAMAVPAIEGEVYALPFVGYSFKF
jgi:hypothetical protein